eukprot:6214004-Amphidinium_carterae.2
MSSLFLRMFNVKWMYSSYFHRWFQQPIWRFGQARVGNGPYTPAGEHHEPISRVWEVPNGNALPDGPSRKSFGYYQQLLTEWKIVTKIPTGTPRPLGGPPMGEKWDAKAVRAGFKKASAPHPDNMISLLDYDLRDRFGRTTKHGQFNMLFSYVSGEENYYQTVHFWFEKKKKMVTSLCYSSESDPSNGEQFRRIN